MSTAVITGASGLLGGNLLLMLADQGVDVRALYRSEQSIAHLKEALGERVSRVTWVKGDLDSVDSLTAAFEGAEVAFHLAAMVSILPKVTPALVRANVEGTANVLEACRRAKVPRLVYTSSSVCVGLAAPGGPDATESAPWNFAEERLDDGYCVTKKQAEELVLAAVRDGLDAVIVNPGFMFGPMDTRPSSGKLIADVANGKVPGVTPGVNSFVDVRDVARGMIAAWRKGRTGERYLLGGHNLSYRELIPLIATRAGVKPPTWNVPRFAAALLGAFGDLQAAVTGKEPLLTSAAVRWSFCDRFRVDSSKAKVELGYTISPIETAIDDALAYFRTRGLVPAGRTQLAA